MAKSFWGSYFISIDPESVNPSFALFDCLGAILCDLLIAGLIDLVYQSGAYEAFAGVLVTRENGIYFRGTEDERPNFEGEQRQYWGTGNIRKQNLREQRNKPIYFRGTRKHVTPPPPERASHIT